MNKSLLECPKCKRAGGIEMRLWQTGAGIFGAVNMTCSHCNGFFILNLKAAKELIFKEIDLPQLPG